MNTVTNKVYESLDGSAIKLEIIVAGRMSQIVLCKNEALEDLGEIEDHLVNGVENIYKFDSDNIITIKINNEPIFNGTVDELGVTPKKAVSISDFNEAQSKLFNDFIDEMSESGKIDHLYFSTDDEGEEQLFLDLTQTDLLINTASIDKKMLPLAEEQNKRYSLVLYGKYEVQTLPVNVKSFKISDLIFLRDHNMDDFTSSAEDTPYCFSGIIHRELGELEFTINTNSIKDEEVMDGWIYDF